MLLRQLILLFIIFLFPDCLHAQLVEVHANYNSSGDVDFTAHNNSPSPLFLNVDFADLENTTFDEELPYVKRLEPGFNTLFTLHRDFEADPPRFNYRIKYFRSDPMAEINLDFPYLFPFAPGTGIEVFNVKDIKGFQGYMEPKGWLATGFRIKPGSEVYAARTGLVVDVSGKSRAGEPRFWYHGWPYAVTLLHADGTLACYKNVSDITGQLAIGVKVYAGSKMGVVPPGNGEVLLLIYNHMLETGDPYFLLPQFVTAEGSKEIPVTSKSYVVAHPNEIRGWEMTGKEKRKILK